VAAAVSLVVRRITFITQAVVVPAAASGDYRCWISAAATAVGDLPN